MSDSSSQQSPIPELEKAKSEALEQSISQLQADHAEESAQQRAQSAEDGRLQDRFRDLLFGHLRPKEAKFKQIADDQRALIVARANFVRRPVLMKGKLPIPRPAANTASVTKVLPFDFTWTSNSGQGSESANKDTGVYDLAVQSIGAHNKSVGAGIGFWFSSDAAGNPNQRFSVGISFSDQWQEHAMGYTAYSAARTWLTVWGMSERGWVATSADQKPSWSQGVGWGQSQAISEGGPSNFETFFNARPNSLYACWVQSSARVDADSGAFGFADSTIHLNVELMFAQFT